MFSHTVAFTQQGKINAIAEDTISNSLYFNNSCDCGVGPANKWTMLSYVNLGTNFIKSPYTFYGPLGVFYNAQGMQHQNSKLYINDKTVFRRMSLPAYSQDWTVNTTAPEKIIASVKRNDSIFTVIDDGAWCNRLEVINANTGAAIPYNSIECLSYLNGAIFGTVLNAKLHGNKIYLTGGFKAYNSALADLDSNAVVIDIASGTMQALNYMTNDTIKDIEIRNNKIHIAGNFTTVKGQARNRYAAFDLSGNLQANAPSFNAPIEQMVVYDDYLVALGKYTTINSLLVNPSGNFVIKGVHLKTNTILNWNLPFSAPVLPNDEFAMESVRNRLYYFSRANSGVFIDAACLPPLKTTTTIATATTAICELTSNVSFSVNPFLYASSYSWLYTGTGASLSINSNSVTVSFANGATSGKLKVVAASACGGFSDTLSLDITILPRPSAIASLVDDTLTCFKPKVPILGSSFTSGVGYSWAGPAGYTSPQQNDSTGKFLPGTYVVTVTNLATGCTRTASTSVKLDTLKPNLTVPAGPLIIPCNPNYITLNGSSTTVPNLIQWRKQLTYTFNPNPYNATSVGTYYMIVQGLTNGCKDSTTVNVTQSAAKPTVTITSHPAYVSAAIAADTISCIQPTVQLNVAYTPTNCSVQWKNMATNSLSANPITVTTQGNYMPIVTRLDNSCPDSSKIVLIVQDIIPPNLSVLTPSPNINCSYSTATLAAVSSPSNAVTVWTGPSSFTSANPAVTTTQGKYYVTTTNPVNGCVKKDSVVVGYANTLVVDAGNDTVVCKNSIVNLSAVVAGTVSPISYSWSNGSNAQNTSVSNPTTTNYVVNVSGGACSGTDTIKVIIPPNIQDSIVTSKGCTGNSGNLVIYAKGGIPPYKYSVNGSAFSSVNTYSNLAFATYAVVIQDSIGCTLSASASINQNSNATVPVFIASTQNFKGDTVVFVDLTTPKADSIGWILPSVASIIGGDMYSPVVVFADTGNFVVTMEAYYGTCMISATKTIRILPFDSAYATISNNNGIKLLNLYPNPNTGVFTVNVEMYKKQNVSIQVWDATSQKQFQTNFIDADLINLPVSLPQLQNGTYILRVIGEYSSKYFNFVISK